MKNNGQFKLLNMEPKILISHYDLNAIRHIVSVAPQEAQWFHRMERIENGDSIYYKIYEMYIPEQVCSATQVESDPMMMVSFFKELREEHGLEETNKIMQNLTVWCHSHHTMGVNPSGQDVRQFAKQCKDALDANIELPQLMMIFNKKDTFYCKLFDPKYGLVFENLPLIVEGYNFDHITSQAKQKFKKPVPPKRKKTYGKRKTTVSRNILDWQWEGDNFYNHNFDSEDLPSLEDYVQSNKNLIENSGLLEASKLYTLKSSNSTFFKQLEKHLTPLHLSALKEAICMDPEIIFEMGSELKWLIKKDQFENEFNDLTGDIAALNLTKKQMQASLIFCDQVAQRITDSPTQTVDLDDILNEFAEAITESKETFFQKTGW